MLALQTKKYLLTSSSTLERVARSEGSLRGDPTVTRRGRLGQAGPPPPARADRGPAGGRTGEPTAPAASPAERRRRAVTAD